MTTPDLSIVTARLTLRPFTHDDLDPLAAMFAEPSFWWFPFERARTVDETRAFLDRVVAASRHARPCEWAVIVTATGELAGYSGLSTPDFLPELLPAVEVGWRLGEAFRGRGYATEAGTAWLRDGFERQGLDRIVSVYEPENETSGAVMRRLGMTLERETALPESGRAVHVYEITRPTWRARNPARIDR